MKPRIPTRKWPPTPAPVPEPSRTFHPVVSVPSDDRPTKDAPLPPMTRLTRHRVVSDLTVTLDVVDDAKTLEKDSLESATGDRGRETADR